MLLDLTDINEEKKIKFECCVRVWQFTTFREKSRHPSDANMFGHMFVFQVRSSLSMNANGSLSYCTPRYRDGQKSRAEVWHTEDT